MKIEQLIWIVLVLLAIVFTADQNEVKRETEHYCAMVDLWNQTNGENGWPDYKESYDDDCKATH